jgi:hypothetical protein
VIKIPLLSSSAGRLPCRLPSLVAWTGSSDTSTFEIVLGVVLISTSTTGVCPNRFREWSPLVELRGNVGWVDLLVESKRGKTREMTGFIAGSDAQNMPVLTSRSDKIATSVLTPKFPVNKVIDLGFKILTYR